MRPSRVQNRDEDTWHDDGTRHRLIEVPEGLCRSAVTEVTRYKVLLSPGAAALFSAEPVWLC